MEIRKLREWQSGEYLISESTGAGTATGVSAHPGVGIWTAWWHHFNLLTMNVPKSPLYQYVLNNRTAELSQNGWVEMPSLTWLKSRSTFHFFVCLFVCLCPCYQSLERRFAEGRCRRVAALVLALPSVTTERGTISFIHLLNRTCCHFTVQWFERRRYQG